MNDAFKKYVKGDRIIWMIIVVLGLFSALVVYSATGNLAYKHHDGNTVHYLFQHGRMLLLGLGIIVLVHNLSYKIFARFALPLLYFSILLLGITLVSGVNLNQANRWMTVPLIGIQFQPSELAKIALIIYVAKILARFQAEDQSPAQAFKPIMIHVLLVCGLIFTQNFSTAALIGLVCMVLMIIGRIPMKYILGTIGAGVLFVVMVFLLSPHVSFLRRAETWKARIERYTSEGESADDPGNFQAERSQMAIATGGLLGAGPGNSKQRYFLPHPYSDFVFAIIVEEFGLWGAVVVILCYLLLLFRAGVIVRASTRTFPALLVVGLSFLLVIQALVNMSVAVGLLPVTGQTLPFLSMGGTSILFTGVALGAILSVSRFNMLEKEAAKNKE